jgi:quercetin dioxygenase-like cupin family protein
MHEDLVRILNQGEGTQFLVLGTTQHIKLTGAETAGAYTLLEESGPAGSGVPLHVHYQEDETFFVLSGSFAFTVSDQSVIAHAGTTVFAPRNVPHSMQVVGDTPGRVLTLVSPPGLERMFEELSDLPDEPDMEQVEEICRRYDVAFL